MVTAGIYQKAPLLHNDERLEFFQNELFAVCSEFDWKLEAWAILSNHYHFLAEAPAEGSASLRELIRKLHSRSARLLNQSDQTPGRKVWHNYLESHVTTEKSHLARLHYIHANAVHHGLVRVAADYPWCSARWFEKNSDPARIKTVFGFPIDRLLEADDW